MSLSVNMIDFGNVFAAEPDTLYFSVENNSGHKIFIEDIDSYNPAFTLIDTSFLLDGGSQQSVGVIFNPVQNIQYNTELVIVPRSGEGNLALDCLGTGRYRDSYYDPTNDLSEEPLKTAMKNLIDNHTVLGYNGARDKMFMEIDNKKVNGQGAGTNTLEGVYTGNQTTGYNSRQAAQNNGFNTEHTFPQGTFSSADPMRSDLFHLFPTLGTANSERSNKPFGSVTNPTWSVGGSKSNASKFEPRPQQKGPSSRAMLYFLIRYQNYANFVSANDQDVLTDWALTYIPSLVEKQRNEDIFQLQHNRNPFIDHPEFIERITSFIGFSQAPINESLVMTHDTINYFKVDPAGTYNYQVVLVNDGNKFIKLNSITVSNNEFSIISSPDTVYPGESGIIDLEFMPQGSQMYLENLSISHSGSLDTLKTPVIANVPPFVGLSDIDNYNWTAYPNPVGGILNLSSGLNEAGEIRIFSADGLLKYRDSHFWGNSSIYTDKWATGLYIVVLKSRDGNQSFKKLIKN